MEVPRLGIQSELQLPAYAQQCRIQALSVTYTAAHGNTRCLTPWGRPGINSNPHGYYSGSLLLSHNRNSLFYFILFYFIFLFIFRSLILNSPLSHPSKEKGLCLSFDHASRLTSSSKPPKISPSSEPNTFTASKTLTSNGSSFRPIQHMVSFRDKSLMEKVEFLTTRESQINFKLYQQGHFLTQNSIRGQKRKRKYPDGTIR